MAQPDIDGALVGGASLDPDEFAQIVGIRQTSDRRSRPGTAVTKLRASLTQLSRHPGMSAAMFRPPPELAQVNSKRGGDATLLTAIIIVIQVIVSLLLIGMILLHSGKGGGLSEMFGGGSGRPRPDPRWPSAISTGPPSPAPSVFFFTTIILAIRSAVEAVADGGNVRGGVMTQRRHRRAGPETRRVSIR